MTRFSSAQLAREKKEWDGAGAGEEPKKKKSKKEKKKKTDAGTE
jgi:hypothetical protein